ncbi:FAD-binding oxidoreductase [Thiosocius teredinicola]|uniref:FAD-binding oxidoreductase n=1 Tax=Thiosocius teredinicola TaxID=1973002 RepID=UPI000990BC24
MICAAVLGCERESAVCGNFRVTNPVIENDKDGSRFEQIPGDTILRAALRSGVGMSYECNSGGCGGCKFELLSGEVESLWPDAPGLGERDKKRGRRLACQCRAIGDVSIKAATAPEYIPPILPRRNKAVLTETAAITHDIRSFRFQSDSPAEFLAGQFAMLDLPGVHAARAYSMANLPNSAGIWEFHIRRVPHGKATSLLFDSLPLGLEIGIDGPYGMGYLRPESPRDLVCVAGGSGLAPMISIARGASAAGLFESQRLFFFYGAREPRDVCGDTMLTALPGFSDRIVYCPVVSSPDAAHWTGATGYVHEEVAKNLPNELSSYEFYFAGPAAMTQALQELLMVEHKVPFDQIHFDRFF